jgi:hypothetical protein
LESYLRFKPPAKGKSLSSTAPLPGGLQQEGIFAMTYGHSPRVFIENGPAEQVARLDAMRSTARTWRALDQARRLELIERALNPANDCIDSFPLAL